jgi:DNA polymerase
MQPFVLIDFETRSTVDLRDVGPYVYTEHPSTEMLCLGWKDSDGQSGLLWPGQPIPAEWLSKTLVAFNVQFERACWRRFFPEIPCPPLEQWHDIQAVCGARGLPQSLDAAVKALGIGVKDSEGHRYVRSLSWLTPDGAFRVPASSIDYDRVGQYCLSDVEMEYELHRHLGYLETKERAFWLVNMSMNERGVALDLETIKAAKEIVAREEQKLEKEFQELTGLNPTQRAKVLAWFQDHGLALPDLTRDTVYAALRDSNLVATTEVHRALTIKYLLSKSSNKKLLAMERSTCLDGRSRGLLQFHGTGPGRSAGRLWQPQNLPRPTVKLNGEYPDVDYCIAAVKQDTLASAFPNFSAMDVISHSLRHFVIANPGHTFISGDFVGIQLRVLLALAGQYDKCEMLASGKSLYEDMGRQIYGRPISKHKDVAEYTIAKNAVLGLGFQMSATTFQERYGKHLDIEFLNRIVRIYREKWAPKVPALWLALEIASLQALKTGQPVTTHGCTFEVNDCWLTVELPSKRSLWYFKPRIVRNRSGSLTWMYEGPRGPVQAFGGLLTENLVMAIEVDIVRDAAIRLTKAGYNLVLDVHDELVCETSNPYHTEAEMKAIMEDVPSWVREMKVPIDVETWTGTRYRK